MPSLVAIPSLPLYLRQDSDYNTRTPRKPFGGVFGGVGGAVASGGAGMMAGDLAAAAGTPSNLGKIGDACMWSLNRDSEDDTLLIAMNFSPCRCGSPRCEPKRDVR